MRFPNYIRKSLQAWVGYSKYYASMNLRYKHNCVDTIKSKAEIDHLSSEDNYGGNPLLGYIKSIAKNILDVFSIEDFKATH